jgi:phosphoribosylanthranilate isomerase
MIIKVCGITRLEDAKLAVTLGAWGVGFIFFTKSPRYLPPLKAAEIISALPNSVEKVGVFVNHPVEEILKIKETIGLTIVQLHGEELPESLSKLPAKTIKALHLKQEKDLAQLTLFKGAWALLLDASRGDLRGGTGETADWELARAAVLGGGKIILAGGLNSQNVERAVERVKPFGLDISSGLESQPGVKDARKMEEFFRKVKA